MTSFRRVAFPLGFAAILGGALLFSLSTARGQNAAAPVAPSGPSSASSPGVVSGSGNTAVGSSPTGAAAPATTVGAPTFPQTIGVSPVYPIRSANNKLFIVQGGTGNDNYDLQIENLYSLLRERGVPIPNILHPLSTAKPSFIIEKLITLTRSSGTAGGGAAPAGGPSAAGAPSGSAGSSTGSGDTRLHDVAITFTQLRKIVQAELTQGTGRLGGGHRQKLTYLLRALQILERQADAVQITSASTATASAATSEANGAEAVGAVAAVGAAVGVTSTKTVQTLAEKAAAAREAARIARAQADSSAAAQLLLEGQARVYGRDADRYTPNIP